jgi:acetyl-CoA carboxylase biotin carboxylase subunit
VIEESPSPLFDRFPDLRPRMGKAAVEVSRAAGYHNAGTVEFLVGPHGNFYFLEMNTRLQVEHPVTEFVTGLDLVYWQIHIAAGEPLTLRQSDIRWRGSAIECRLYAEDPEQNFFPSPGLIRSLLLPAGPGVRVDSGVYQGWTVPMDYDPLLAKLTVWGETRDVAASRLLRALRECHVGGIATNLAFFREVIADPEFRAGNLHTGFIDEWRLRRQSLPECPRLIKAAASAAAVQPAARATASPDGRRRPSPWVDAGRSMLFR